jgi:ABC-type lipoprotein export system ATPase subunit
VTSSKQKILVAESLSCSRELPGEIPSRLHDVSLAFDPSTFTVVTGPAGCGKNLLLRILGLLEEPEEGTVLLHGAPTGRLMEQERAVIRNQYFGFLFGEPFLLPAFSALENVAMPFFKISARNTDEARKRTEAMLEFAGMGEKAHANAGELSFLEQQRVSLARALVNHPEILMIENIDRNLRDGELAGFAELVQRAVAEFHVTAIITASCAKIGSGQERTLEMGEGRVLFDSAAAVASGGPAK